MLPSRGATGNEIERASTTLARKCPHSRVRDADADAWWGVGFVATLSFPRARTLHWYHPSTRRRAVEPRCLLTTVPSNTLHVRTRYALSLLFMAY